MKIKHIVALSVFVFLSSEAFSQKITKCRAFEFAELQTMSKGELVELYCKNKNIKTTIEELQAISARGEVQMIGFSARFEAVGAKQQSREADSARQQYGNEVMAYVQDGNMCDVENERVFRLIKKDSANEVPPTCGR